MTQKDILQTILKDSNYNLSLFSVEEIEEIGEQGVHENLAHGRYSEHKVNWANEWLRLKEVSKREALEQEARALAREANELAREVNLVARESSNVAREANDIAQSSKNTAIIAAIAAIVAAAAAIVTVIITIIK